MEKTHSTISGVIEELFSTLTRKEQVALMTSLYYSMYDAQKDEFLEETGNL